MRSSGGSSNGRTTDSDSVYLGSNPSPPANTQFQRFPARLTKHLTPRNCGVFCAHGIPSETIEAQLPLGVRSGADESSNSNSPVRTRLTLARVARKTPVFEVFRVAWVTPHGHPIGIKSHRRAPLWSGPFNVWRFRSALLRLRAHAQRRHVPWSEGFVNLTVRYRPEAEVGSTYAVPACVVHQQVAKSILAEKDHLKQLRETPEEGLKTSAMLHRPLQMHEEREHRVFELELTFFARQRGLSHTEN